MQYQNVKRNTMSLNKWKTVVNTPAKINASLDTSSSYNFIMPGSTWINTTNFDSSFYSGYQMFFQLPGFQNTSPLSMPEFTIQTELVVEFMQPAFQSSPSTFSHEIFDAELEVIVDPLLPNDYTSYVFKERRDVRLPTGERDYKISFVPTMPGPGILPVITYNSLDFIALHRENTSGQYYGNRRVKYTGPPPDIYHQY